MTKRLFLLMFVLGMLLMGGSLGAAMILTTPGFGRLEYFLSFAALAGVAFWAVGLILYIAWQPDEESD